MRPCWWFPEQQSFCVDLSYGSIDFLVHRSQVFPAHFSRKDQTTVLVYISSPGLIKDVVANDIFKIFHLRGNDSPDLGQFVHRPELVVVEALVDVTGLVGDITTEPVLNPCQWPGKRSLRANPDIEASDEFCEIFGLPELLNKPIREAVIGFEMM